MPASIGVNLRVTGHCRQGGRKYMEDFFSVAYQQTEDERDLEYAFFGIYDGHGGSEAAAYAKEHLMELIVRQKNFWSDNDEDVLKAIKEGYIATHYAMWKEQAKWPKTASGLPSTAGTTASIAFIRRGKIYIGHVGDSGIVLGYQEPGSPDWQARPLTKDHKPESAGEIQRIEQSGGKVVSKSGVPRVVWNRPRLGHQGPIRRSTPIDEIPFLAVARSLGDLWSYNSQLDEFVVSPDPDCVVIPIDTNCFRCLIFGTDGLYNMLSPQMAVHIVQHAEKHNENAALSDDSNKVWINPSKCLVEKALERWLTTKMRADNTSVITLLLDPPGPPRAQVLQNRKRKAYPDSGLEIVTRYEGEEAPASPKRSCLPDDSEPMAAHQTTQRTDKNIQVDLRERTKDVAPAFSASELLRRMSAEHAVKNSQVTSAASAYQTGDKCEIGTSTEDDLDFVPNTRESTSFDPRGRAPTPQSAAAAPGTDANVQINEISSSCNDDEDESSSAKAPTRTRSKSERLNGKNRQYQVMERPVLRSRNSKSSTEQLRKPPIKADDRRLKQNRLANRRSASSLGGENRQGGSPPRQLRVRPGTGLIGGSSKAPRVRKPDGRFKTLIEATSPPGPSAAVGPQLEWLSAAMYRDLIRHKNVLHAKKLLQKTKRTRRGRLKDMGHLEGGPRRSGRHSGGVSTDALDNAAREEAAVKRGRGRGRPQGSKNWLNCRVHTSTVMTLRTR